MQIDLFLWPMLLPLFLPLVYCLIYKRESLGEIVTLLLMMSLIVVLYWPLVVSDFLCAYTYIVVKLLLFVVLPLALFLVLKRDCSPLNGRLYGIRKEGARKSVGWCVLFLPLMLAATSVIHFYYGVTWDANVSVGVLSFFEAFTEEFFFRGILFIFLLKKTNVTVASVTSLASFVLMHPQNFDKLYILGTIVQGILTLEIARRSQNILGCWLLHGANRFFSLALLPLVL